MKKGVERFLDIGTDEAIVFKCLGKVLLKNFSEGSFMITQHGIFVSENTDDESVLLESLLKREQFTTFVIPTFENQNSTLKLGFSTRDFQQATDGITKTDSYRMYVLASKPNILCILITNDTKKKKCERFIPLRNTKISNVTSPSYQDHLPTATVTSAQYKRSIVEAKKMSKHKVRIKAQKFGAIMESPESQMGGFKETWGTIEGLTEEEQQKLMVYHELIATARLHSMAELVQITKTIRIYACSNNKPLRLCANAGSLGSISLYLDGLPEVIE